MAKTGSVTTAFLYSGRLAIKGSPADGLYDVRCALYTARSGGSQVGPAITKQTVPIAKGRFDVVLDFGSEPFDGGKRWLELEWRGSHSDDKYVGVKSRTLLPPAPYAIYAYSASAVALHGRPLSPAPPESKAILTWDGMAWTPALDLSWSSISGAPTAFEPAGPAGGDLTGVYPNPSVADGAVSTSTLANAAVTETKVAAGAVTTTKLADDAVGTVKLATAAVTTIKLADEAVVSAKLGNAAVTATKLATGAVSTAKLSSGGVTAEKLAVGAIVTEKLANGAVTTEKLADSIVTAAKLSGAGATTGQSLTFDGTAVTWGAPAAGSPTGTAGGDLTGTYPNPTVAAGKITSDTLAATAVTEEKLGVGAVTTPKLGDGAVTTSKLADRAVTARILADDAVTDLKLAAASVTTLKVADGAVIGSKLGDGAVTETKLGASAVTTTRLADGAVAPAKLADRAVTTPKLFDAVVSTQKLADGAVSEVKLADAAVATTKLADGAVSEAKLAAAAVTTAKLTDRAVTLAKLDPTGAASGQAIVFDGTAVGWRTPLGGPPTGSAGGDLTGTYPNPVVADGRVTSAKLANAAVTEAKLAANAVTAPKLGANAVTTAKLENFAVTTLKVADGSVTTPKLADRAVTPVKIDPTGATNGQTLVVSGTTVRWGMAGATLSLPFDGQVASGYRAFGIVNNDPNPGVGSAAVVGSAPNGRGVVGDAVNGQGVYGSGRVGVMAIGQLRGLVAMSDELGVRIDAPQGMQILAEDNCIQAAVVNPGAYAIRVFAQPDAHAAHFTGNVSMSGGNVTINGNLSKAGGSFRIDHPLDPANRYLHHAFVESPDMKNVYDGVVTLDATGAAVVKLPDWFETLNRDCRYQLTALGRPGPDLHVAKEIAGGQFQIAGGAAGMRVSWQVTGIRQDAWANAHRIPVEEEKSAGERGAYLHPVEHGQPEAKGIEQSKHAKERDRLKGNIERVDPGTDAKE